MTRFLMSTAVLLAVAAPGYAQQAATDATATPAAPAAKPKKICRTFQVTGRRIAQSQCATAEQWAEYDRAGEDGANGFINGVSNMAAKGGLSAGSSGGLSTSSLFGLGPQ